MIRTDSWSIDPRWFLAGFAISIAEDAARQADQFQQLGEIRRWKQEHRRRLRLQRRLGPAGSRVMAAMNVLRQARAAGLVELSVNTEEGRLTALSLDWTPGKGWRDAVSAQGYLRRLEKKLRRLGVWPDPALPLWVAPRLVPLVGEQPNLLPVSRVSGEGTLAIPGTRYLDRRALLRGGLELKFTEWPWKNAATHAGRASYIAHAAVVGGPHCGIAHLTWFGGTCPWQGGRAYLTDFVEVQGSISLQSRAEGA